jgi:hypothetical protein
VGGIVVAGGVVGVTEMDEVFRLEPPVAEFRVQLRSALVAGDGAGCIGRDGAR